MIKFSEKNQAFYDLTFKYDNLPDDLIDIDSSQHIPLLQFINDGYYLFSDLSHSEQKKPSRYCTFDKENNAWIDSRTEEEKYSDYLRTLRPLTRRQFRLTLVEYGLDDDIEAAIAGIEDSKQRKQISIEYNDSQSFERSSESVLFIASLIELPETQLNEMWEHAMSL